MFHRSYREKSELLKFLLRFSSRLRLRDGWLGMQNTLWAAMLAALIVQIAGRALPIPRLLLWTLLPLGVWLAGNLILAIFLPLPPLQVARRVDLELHLKERLSSSLALAEVQPESAGGRMFFVPSLIENLHRDALQAARGVDVRQAFPLQLLRRPLITAGILLLAILVMAFVPNPMDDVLAQRAAVARAAQEQAAQIEKLQESIEKPEQLSPEEREELLKKLAELAEKLKNNKGDLEKALADLALLEQELRDKLDPDYAAKQAALDAMLAQLKELAKQNGITPPAEMETADLLEELAEQLEKMDDAEKEALAQALAQMSAQAAQAGDSSLAQALAELSQAAQSGDSQSDQKAASDAAQALKDAQQNMAGQAAAAQVLSGLQASRQALANAAAQAPGNNPSGNPGQGQNPGNQPGSGQGSQADTLPPFTGSGQPKPPTGDPGAQDPAGENSKLGPAYQEQGGHSDELYIPGMDTGQGQYEEKEKEDPLGGLDNPALIPYQQVYSTYRDAASQAIEKSYIPLGLKDYIRDYFTQLEPQAGSAND